MFTKLILEVCLCLTVAAGASMPRCDFTQGIQPVKVINSKYSIENGTFCCPETSKISNCTYSPEEMNCVCPHGIVDDPCLHCKTCGKTLGEVCGGAFGTLGLCVEGYVCTADSTKFLDGANITGICKHKEPRKEYETCDEINKCQEGFTCMEVANKSMCVASGTKIRETCTKNCSELPTRPHCGSDGRIYNNICALRQTKCLSHFVTKVDCPKHYCQSIEAPANGSINYSSQLIIDKIDCNPGFEPEYDENPDIYVEFPAAFDCVCLKSGECKWYYGPNDDKEVTFENLPRCVNTREKNCQMRAEKAEDKIPKRELKNTNQSNLAA